MNNCYFLFFFFQSYTRLTPTLTSRRDPTTSTNSTRSLTTSSISTTCFQSHVGRRRHGSSRQFFRKFRSRWSRWPGSTDEFVVSPSSNAANESATATGNERCGWYADGTGKLKMGFSFFSEYWVMLGYSVFLQSPMMNHQGQQGPNQMESPGNLLQQQPPNFDVQVSVRV